MLLPAALISLLSSGLVTAHMAMVKPCPRYSSNPNCPKPPAGQTVDYSIKSPIGIPTQINQPWCKYQTPYDKPVATYEAGSAIPVEFMAGGAAHGGGHCQFSLSYDGGRTFVVLQSIMNRCFREGLTFNVPIPENAPPSNRVVFAWSWINAIGNREFYMNCADIAITGGQVGGRVTGPQMVVANYGPDTPVVPEFFYSGDTKAELYERAALISVGPEGPAVEEAESGAEDDTELYAKEGTKSRSKGMGQKSKPDPTPSLLLPVATPTMAPYWPVPAVTPTSSSQLAASVNLAVTPSAAIEVSAPIYAPSKEAPPPMAAIIPPSPANNPSAMDDYREKPLSVVELAVTPSDLAKSTCQTGEMKCDGSSRWMQCVYDQWVTFQTPPQTSCGQSGQYVSFS
ncbi:hypothetical protein BJ085DRAFT_31726 [Dimargaris cristalligena]|uniref:Chitin-binding type-4 domain-containing protein n=1 Tax=Dimargaris cristalligena TaxID=215637 RepID=A0A4P9ZSA4_9FUNG|nr:hypothetical protein BJ085DRAFT_31726 [Dimargaris cristalligena]|eukprot:RKP36353.1 hypothetical protein BJ085DRAFT_31726 [Dimargaris cristalligena]